MRSAIGWHAVLCVLSTSFIYCVPFKGKIKRGISFLLLINCPRKYVLSYRILFCGKAPTDINLSCLINKRFVPLSHKCCKLRKNNSRICPFMINSALHVFYITNKLSPFNPDASWYFVKSSLIWFLTVSWYFWNFLQQQGNYETRNWVFSYNISETDFVCIFLFS